MATSTDADQAAVIESKRQALISVRSVNKTYQGRFKEVQALSDVKMDVQEGSFVSLVGASGCGKTTLLQIIAGLVPASAGSVAVDGVVVDGPSRAVGVMFQTPVLFPWRTVLENVVLPLEIFSGSNSSDEQRALSILKLVGLEGFERSYPHELSGGMQQRVALSRLLIFDPSLLLLDEPFSALDEFTREALNLELQRLWIEKALTIVFVTHNIAEAVFLSDQVYVMSPSPGRVVGKVEVGFERPRKIELMKTANYAEAVFEVREMLGVAR